MSTADLRQRMAKGAMWTVFLRMVDRSIGLVSTLILARLLVPADFGVVAMAMSIVAALEILSAFNFDLALIQRRDADRKHYDAAWTLNVGFGILNASALILLSGLVADFYREPRVRDVMLVLALYVVIQAFANIGIVAFQKELQFHKEFLLGVTRRLCGFAVTVSLALYLRSYWALVAGMIATASVGLLLSYAMHPYRPRFGLSGCRELFHFSAWLLVNNILIFIVHRGSDFFIGRFAGPKALGTYNVAYEISNLPTTELVFPISRAVFPAYSRMSADPAELRRGFLDVLAVLLILVVPAGLGIASLASPIVLVLLGEKWIDAIPLVQVLAIFGILRASLANTGSVFLALGQPQLTTWLTLLQTFMLLCGLSFAVPTMGSMGAAIVALLAAACQVPLVAALLSRRLGFRLAELGRIAWRPICAGVIMSVSVSIAGAALRATSTQDLISLAILIPLGGAMYISALAVLWLGAGRPAGGEEYLLRYLGSWCNALRLQWKR